MLQKMKRTRKNVCNSTRDIRKNYFEDIVQSTFNSYFSG